HGHRAQKTYTSLCRSTYLAISESGESIMIGRLRRTQPTRYLHGLQSGSRTPAVSRAQEPQRGTSGGCCASAPLQYRYTVLLSVILYPPGRSYQGKQEQAPAEDEYPRH